MKLQQKYNSIIQEYIDVFINKQALHFDGWIDEIGGNADFNPYVFYFGDIKTDIDNRVKKGKIIDYQEYCLEQYDKKGQPMMNYIHWLKSNLNK